MVDGFVKYANTRSDIQLIIAGKSSSYGQEMSHYISNFDNVFYLGYLSRNDVNWLLKNCSGTVLLSFCEGLAFLLLKVLDMENLH